MAKKSAGFKAIQKKGSADKGVKVAEKAPKAPQKDPKSTVKGKC
jgi:hypothetical protein